MIDLHLHLDGSLVPALLLKLAKEEGVRLPAQSAQELVPFLTAPKTCGSLNEYLEKFSLPVSCMQSETTLAEAAEGLVQELAQQGLCYAEIRFAPQLHRQKGLGQRQVVSAVIGGIRTALKKQPQIQIGLLLCCMRGADNHEENLETIRLVAEFYGDIVCGADLAGAEALFPTRDFSREFALASAYRLPYTIHAGEAAGPESIRAALDLGAKRIGHGVRVMEDPALLNEIRERQIPLEVCLTSNMQTKALGEGTVHPLLELLRKGVKVTVNTDNMTVSGTTIAHEFACLKEMGMTVQEEQKLLLNAADAAFLEEEKKEKLRESILSGTELH